MTVNEVSAFLAFSQSKLGILLDKNEVKDIVQKLRAVPKDSTWINLRHIRIYARKNEELKWEFLTAADYATELQKGFKDDEKTTATLSDCFIDSFNKAKSKS